ncbi:hypothetical protein Pint_14408 [Pistacia integerrima]|uniref:Uncharacterized protein n=1 Tax=Pistacia integerrima TaxID=434235 RepID=A0ACC0Y516_9ROSI|nr:hypothetical protein Pint_14408 [Pistacia integerrima]
MEIHVKKTSVVRPAQQTPSHSLEMSNLDLLNAHFGQVPLVYFYRRPAVSERSDFFDTSLLKEALSKALVAFYPLAGRLKRDENGRLQIECNAEGVLFMEAETSCVIDDEFGDDNFTPSLKMRQLVPSLDYSSKNISSSPLLVSQVTYFKCGGVCLGVGWHHILGDGTSGLNFIKSWAEITSGFSITNPPFIDRTILKSRTPPYPTFDHIEYHPPPELQSGALPTSMTRVELSLDRINFLKTKFKEDYGVTYSTYEILAAHVWRCVCKARGLPNDQATKLYIPTNGRLRFNPPLPLGIGTRNFSQTMEIKVKETSVVGPAQETPKHGLWISKLDLLDIHRAHIPLVYFYRRQPSQTADRSYFFGSCVLKEALSKALVAFYPLAGRLGRDENGRLQIDCNGEGVLFMEAETSCAIEDDFTPSLKMRQLVPTIDYSTSDISFLSIASVTGTYDPNIKNVTYFKCGGICLGIGWHHILGDGTSAFHFIKSWAEITSGFSISVPPFIDRTILHARIPPHPTFNHIEYHPPPSMDILESQSSPRPTSMATFRLPLDQINAFKAKLKNEDGATYSTFVILAAHIWRCVCKARGLPGNQSTKLIHTNRRTIKIESSTPIGVSRECDIYCYTDCLGR